MIPILLENWQYVVGFLGVFLIAYWAFDERDQTESVGETIERVAERSQAATGGVVGAAGSIAVVIIATVSTVGSEVVMSGMRIANLIGTDPVLSGGVAVGGLGAAAVDGLIPIKTWQFVALVALFLVAGTIWRERAEE